MERPFWLVWSPTGMSPPSHRHTSYESAKTEAQRLANTTRGEFFVLEAVGVARRVDVHWFDIAHEETTDGEHPNAPGEY